MHTVTTPALKHTSTAPTATLCALPATVAAPTDDTQSAQEQARLVEEWRHANQSPQGTSATAGADPAFPQSPQGADQRGDAPLSSAPGGAGDSTSGVAQVAPTDGRIGDTGGGTGGGGVSVVLVIVCTCFVALFVSCVAATVIRAVLRKQRAKLASQKPASPSPVPMYAELKTDTGETSFRVRHAPIRKSSVSFL